MPLMPQIFVGGEFRVYALGLEYNPKVPPERCRLAHRVEANNRGDSRCRHHESGENPKERRLAASIRAKQSEQFGGLHIERYAVKCGAILVAMHNVTNRNNWAE